MGPIHLLDFAAAPPRAEASGLRVHVVYTGPRSTLASLAVATELASDLGARIELLVPAVVPFPLPLTHPTTSRGFLEDTASALVRDSAVDVEVRVLLCRDRQETIPRYLPSQSIAVIGRDRRWGPNSSRGLIRRIQREGHHVIVVDRNQSRGKAPAPVFESRGSR